MSLHEDLRDGGELALKQRAFPQRKELSRSISEGRGEPRGFGSVVGAAGGRAAATGCLRAAAGTCS